jgi:multiple sugar transport system substrate-binding protein
MVFQTMANEAGNRPAKHTRRRFLQGTGATASALALAGCLGGGGGGGDGESNTVRYLSDRGDSKEVMDAIIAEFEEQSDYTVEVTYTSKGTSTDQEMQKMVAAGNPPDILFDTSTDAYRLQRDGVLAPLTDAVSNNDLPETWENWQAEAKRVSEEEDMQGYIVQSGQTNNADTQMTQYLWQNDVQIYSGPSDNIEVTLDNDDNRAAAIETFEWVQQMAEYSPNGSGWEWGDAIGALQQENAAAGVSVGGLPILIMSSNRPELVKQFSPMPFPVPQGKEQDKWWAYMEGHLVRNDGQATEGAQEFVKFFNQSEKFFDFVLSAPLFQFPPSREQLDSDAVKNNETLNEYPEVLELVKDNWDVFTSVLATGDEGAPNLLAADGYGNQVFGQAADQLLVGGKSPEETVDWLAEKLRSLKR